MSIHTLVYFAAPLGDNLVAVATEMAPPSSGQLLHGLDRTDAGMTPGLLRPCRARG